jgi:hypothetical protein
MDHENAGAPLLGGEATPPPPPFASRKPLLAVLAGAALVGLGYTVGLHDEDIKETLDLESDSTSSGFLFVPLPKNDGSGDYTSMTAANTNLAIYGPEGVDYPWMDGLLVEPYLETTFVSNGDSKSWSLTSVDMDSGTTLETVKTVEATEMVHTFTTLGKYTITIDDDETASLYVKYVRRELRALSDGAKTNLFMAWKKVIDMKDEDLGKATYGEDFTSLSKLAALHNNWAGAEDCDHLHDGEEREGGGGG